MVTGELDVQQLVKTLNIQLHSTLFVFVTLRRKNVPQEYDAQMVFHEDEGTTVIMPHERAVKFNLDYEFPCRMITLNVHSSLQAVGFIARISSELTKHGIALNPVSGFYHDHLFIGDGQHDHAVKVLENLKAEYVG